ncbi:MAG: tRNA-dihydrouridine synthase [Patescibacteria group bacterium]
MELGFWEKLKKPFFALAPMLDVTDAPFRAIIAKYSKPFDRAQGEPAGPDVFWTEFVSADGLMSKPKLPEGAVGRTSKPVLGGREHLLHMLKYSEAERPIVAQLFSGNPEKMRGAAAFCAELGFDGIDINMGCPDKSVEKGGAGAALIKNIPLAKELIRAAKEGAGGLPVSVKTRVGYNKVEIETWIPALLEEGIAALTIHARTRKEMSKVPARWKHIARAVEIRDEMKVPTLIIGNGDVKDMADARAKAAKTKCDGVMLGRAIFGNPWLFNQDSLCQCSQEHWHRESVGAKGKLKVMVEHTKLFEEMLGLKRHRSLGRTDSRGESVLGGIKSFAIMKKHFKAYAEGFPGAKDLRIKLMETKNAEEVEAVAKIFLEM